MNWNESIETYLCTLGESTAKQYRVALKGFVTWYVQTYGEYPDLTLLTDEEAREWRGYLSGVRNLKAATVNVRLSALKGLIRYFGRSIKVQGMRKEQSPIEPLTGRELGRLLASVEGSRWMDKRNVALVSIMARAGLRVGEAVALDLADIEINERSGWALIRLGKGLKERRVPLSLQTRKDLSVYLKVRPRSVTEALFLSKTGRRMGSRDVERMVKTAGQQVGINKRVTPHVCRHTFATRFLRKGGDLATLQAILGHRSLETTSRYLHPDAARVQEMVEGL